MSSRTISFGLIAILVKRFHAVRKQSVSFNQLDERNMERIRYRKVNAETGEEVKEEHIVIDVIDVMAALEASVAAAKASRAHHPTVAAEPALVAELKPELKSKQKKVDLPTKAVMCG